MLPTGTISCNPSDYKGIFLYPRVIITAVNKKNKNPEIQYFNNCLDDDLCKSMYKEVEWHISRIACACRHVYSTVCDQ